MTAHEENAARIVMEVMSAFGSGAGKDGRYPDGQIFDSHATSSKFTDALLSETVKNLSANPPRFTYDEWKANNGTNVNRPMVLETAAKHGNLAGERSSRPSQRPINWGTVRSTFDEVKEKCPTFGPVCPFELPV